MIRFRSRIDDRGQALLSGFVVSLCLCLPVTAQAQRATGSRPTVAETAPTDAGSATSGGRVSGSGEIKSNRAARNDAMCANEEAAGEAKQPLAAGDRKLMRELAQLHLKEVKLSGLATAVSENEAVRAYAQKVLEEHMKGMDELRKLARQNGVILPGGLDKEQAATLHELAVKAGPDFDRLYLDQSGPQPHAEARRTFEEAGKSSSPALKAYAGSYLPVMDQHIALAQKIIADPKNGLNAVQAETKAGQSTSTEAASGTASNPAGNSSGTRGGASLSGNAVGPK